jgi:uncharacterized protein DUF2442
MLVDVVHVEARAPYVLHLRFGDGVEGDVDLERLVRFEGIFEALRAPEVFALVRVDSELGTIVWPNGADLDPVVLHAAVQGGNGSAATR